MSIKLSNRRGATLILPSTVSWRRVPLGITVPSVANAHGHGTVVVGPSRVEARQITLSGPIFYVPKERIQEEADRIIRFLMEPPIELYWDTERRLIGYPTGVPQEWIDARAELTLNISFVIPDPYFYGSEVVVSWPAATIRQVEVAGTAPTLPVVRFSVTAAGSGLQLTNSTTGHVLEIEGEYYAGDVVEVHTATFEVALTRAGVTEPIIDRLSDTFLATGFELVPDTNMLQYSGPAADVQLTYRPRWY